MTAAPDHRPGLGLLAATSAVVVWGASTVAIKQVEGLGGLAIACYRVWLAAVLITIGYRATGRRITWELLRVATPGGLMFLADLVLFFLAVQETSIANAAVIGALQPLLVLAVSRRLFGELPRLAELVWGAVAIVGVVLVVAGGDAGGVASGRGDLLAVGALVAWAAYFVATKAARQQLDAFAYLTGMSIVAAIAVTPLPLLAPGTLGGTTTSGWLTILYITVVNGLLGHFLMSWAHATVSLLTVSLLTLAIPVIGAATAWVVLDESLTGIQMVGMVVVLAALALVTVSTARRARAVLAADVEAMESAPHP